MADESVIINAATVPGGASIAVDEIGGISHELVKIEFGVDGVATQVSAADPLPVHDPLAATAANQQTDALTDAELRASAVPVSLAAVPLPSGAATAAKQDEQTAQLATLNSLIETLRSLVAVLSPLGGAMNAGAPALRTTPIASVSTAVTGTLTAVTTVGTITNFGTAIPAKEMADDINNFTVTLANINNVTS